MVLLDVKEREISDSRKADCGVVSGEITAFCPQCKALQTVCIEDDTLVPTRRFFQAGSRIYHDCGSSQPCRLYAGW